MDHAEIKKNIKQESTWLKGLYLLIYAFIFWLVELIFAAIVIFQFFVTLITGKPNQRLLALGRTLTEYIQEIMMYMTFNSETRPYPFGDWPEAK